MAKKINEKKKADVNIEYGIKSIKEVSYSMNDSMPTVAKDLELSISTKVEFVVKSNEIVITPLIKYSNAKFKKEVLKIEVSNVFGVKNMKKFELKSRAKEPTYNFPEDFMNSLIGVSISHSRAFLAKNTSGTKLEKFILPMMRVSDLVGKNE